MNRTFRFQLASLAIGFLLNVSCTPQEASQANTAPVDSEGIPQHSRQVIAEKLAYSSGVRSILHDRQGNYWFGSHQEGVCLYDGKSFTYFTVENGLSDNQVRTIQEDDTGTIWFGTAGGVSSFEGQEIVSHSPIHRFPGLGPMKTGNWKGNDHDLWFNAGHKAGAHRFDGKELTYAAFPIQGDENRGDQYGVTGFTRPRNGHIWIATYAAAFRHDGESFLMIDNQSLGYDGSNGQLHIRSILEDSKGRVWIGNNGIGVLLIEGGKTTNFSEEQNLIHTNSSRSGDKSPVGTLEHVFAMREDRHGNIWFGDRDTGAWKYDGTSMTNYSIDAELSSQHIWEIYEDRNGDLLFAMGEGGVYLFGGDSFERKF